MKEKVVAERLFQNKNALYNDSIAQPFKATTVGDSQQETAFMKYFMGKIKPNDEKLSYVHMVTKYDRTGYQMRKRYFMVTNNSIFILNVSDFKLKDKICLSQIKEISVSGLMDGLFVIHMNMEKNGQKGDVILQSDRLIETITKITVASPSLAQHISHKTETITHYLSNGKNGVIEIRRGAHTVVCRGKNGHLTVMAPPAVA
ncbi:Unconventional myosin-Ic-A [Lamellibrachia satsuma]|nr:Unconventional myosin-Ic-A [Lamellibrachia satsuma]